MMYDSRFFPFFLKKQITNLFFRNPKAAEVFLDHFVTPGASTGPAGDLVGLYLIVCISLSLSLKYYLIFRIRATFSSSTTSRYSSLKQGNFFFLFL